MDYEEVKLMIQNRKAQESKSSIREHTEHLKSVSEETDYKNIWDKLLTNHDNEYAYIDFKKKLNDAYVVEGLTVLIDNCVNPVLIKEEYNQKLVRQLVSNFVKEEGSEDLLSRFKRTSYLMSEMAYIIECQVQSILEKVDKNNSESFKIDSKDKDKFYEKLGNIDAEDSIDKITNRVREQTTDFVNANMTEKANLSASLSKTQKKVEDNKEKLKEKANCDKAKNEADKLEEGYISMGKRRAVDIVESRSKNIFENMVYNLSRSAMINENANKVFVKDSRLNMEKIVEHCEVLCTFVTALDSLKIINVDESYIENMLSDMKK